ncbi:MAG: hypothetical protein NT099_02190 [Candidatus Saganbacteria bacterium]|nr:hypothetical protein [Candidatus Saganbacteria bacterium]
MSTIIFETGLPRNRVGPSRAVPGWGINRTAWNIVLSEPKKVSVGEDGLYAQGKKIPWSRLTAFHLSRLGITSIEATDPLDLVPILRAASSAKNAADLASPGEGVLTLNLSEVESFKAFVQHPQTTVADIYHVLKDAVLAKDKIVEAVKELEKRSAFDVAQLRLSDVFHAIPAISSADKLEGLINDPPDKAFKGTRKAAFKRLKAIRPDGFLVNLSAPIIAVFASPADLALLPQQNRAAQAEVIAIVEASLHAHVLQLTTTSYSLLPGLSDEVLVDMEKLFALGKPVMLEALPLEALAAIIPKAAKATKSSPPFDQWLKGIVSGKEEVIAGQLKAALEPLVHSETVGTLYCAALEAMGKGREPAIALAITTYHSASGWNATVDADF